MSCVRQIWGRVRAFADSWFFDEGAFTFKGITTLGAQLLGILAVLVSVQLFRQSVVVIAENVDPVACFDVAQYEERFALAGEAYSERIRQALKGFALRDWKNSFPERRFGRCFAPSSESFRKSCRCFPTQRRYLTGQSFVGSYRTSTCL